MNQEQKPPIVVLGEMSKRIKELEAERDHWKAAYCKAEQESARFEEAYQKIYRKLQAKSVVSD